MGNDENKIDQALRPYSPNLRDNRYGTTGFQKNPNWKPIRDEKGRFLPGTGGKPVGAMRLHQSARIARQELGADFYTQLHKYWGTPAKDLLRLSEEPNLSSGNRILAALLIKAMNGSVNSLKVILEYSLGKAPQSVNLNINDQGSQSPLSQMDQSQLLGLVNEAIQHIKDKDSEKNEREYIDIE